MFEAVKTRRERERDESKVARFPHSDSQLSLSTYTPSSLFSSPPFWLDSSAHTRRTDRASKWKVTRGRGVRVEGEFRRKGVCTRTSDTRHQTQKKKTRPWGQPLPDSARLQTRSKQARQGKKDRIVRLTRIPAHGLVSAKKRAQTIFWGSGKEEGLSWLCVREGKESQNPRLSVSVVTSMMNDGRVRPLLESLSSLFLSTLSPSHTHLMLVSSQPC